MCIRRRRRGNFYCNDDDENARECFFFRGSREGPIGVMKSFVSSVFVGDYKFL